MDCAKTVETEEEIFPNGDLSNSYDIHETRTDRISIRMRFHSLKCI